MAPVDRLIVSDAGMLPNGYQMVAEAVAWYVPGRQVSATSALAPNVPPVSASSTRTPSRNRSSDRLMPEVKSLQLTNELAVTTPPLRSGVPIDMEHETAADAGVAGT